MISESDIFQESYSDDDQSSVSSFTSGESVIRKQITEKNEAMLKEALSDSEIDKRTMESVNFNMFYFP